MKNNLRLILGILFVVMGALFVLQNLNVFPDNSGNILWAALFGAVSIFFLSLYFKKRENWWLILGVSTLSFAGGNLASLLTISAPYAPLFSLFGAGISFLLLYLVDRRQWWAIVPSAILLSLGIDALLQIASPEANMNGIIFFGLGIGFLFLYLVPLKEGRINWAMIPISLFLLLGLLSTFEQGNIALQITGPAIILLAGLGVLIYSFRKK